MHRIGFAASLILVGPVLIAPAWADITDPIPPKIAKGVTVELKPIATGLTSPVGLIPATDGSNKQFVVEQTGQIRVIQAGTLQSTPLIDMSGQIVPLMPGYDERGLLGLAFDPGFDNPASPGFDKFYTQSTQPVSGAADFTVPLPVGATFNAQTVIQEWTVSAQNRSIVDPNIAPREIMRVDKPQFNHNGGTIAFGSDKNLYIGLGDGGAANDVGNGHTPNIGNAQDTSNVLGKMLRIDVHGNNSANHQYGIPADNPFVGGGGLPEIYAQGLRNPYSFSFDKATGNLILGDVGQNKIEEIDQIIKGGNYGWHIKEGTFLFDPTTGGVTANSPGSPAGLIDPLAQYDHDEGIAIVGGFIYHGTAIPLLDGKYVFGDFSTSFGAPGGRLFYADLSTGLIQELMIGLNDRALGLFVKGIGEDANGELYVLGSTTLGPAGTTGVVLEIVPVPEPAAVVLLAIGMLSVIAFAIARRRRSCHLWRLHPQRSLALVPCPADDPQMGDTATKATPIYHFERV